MADDDILKEIREQTDYACNEWKDICDEGDKNMRFVTGDPWETYERTQREAAKRPLISPDELGQYTNQAINDVRANKRAVKFAPSGNGANDQTAQFYADKWREIEYRSRAQIHYTTAFQNAIERGYGFIRIGAKYESPRSSNQELYIDGFPNPNLVKPDPDALMPDSSDQKFCTVRQPYLKTTFKSRWPKAKVKDFNIEHEKMAPGWFKGESVLVGEFWKVNATTRKLLTVLLPGAQNFEGIFEDELKKRPLPQGATVHRSEEREDQSVCQYLTNGIEILSKTEWPGRYIPIVSCLGKVLYVDEGGATKRKILSMVNLARDPYKLYCYCRTCEAELVGMTPKFPYFVYKGQLDATNLQLLAKSLHEPVAAIEVNPTAPGLPADQILPHPQRQPYDPAIIAVEALAESMRRAIQASMGWTPLPSQAQRRNDKSGVALKQIEESGQRGSFHFTDHYLDMLTHGGIVGEDLMDKYYDTEREVGIRKPDDKAEIIRINTQDGPTTKGDHAVTVSTGPSNESERDAAEDLSSALIESQSVAQIVGPQKMQKLLALALRLRNAGALVEQMAEVIDPTLRPDGKQDPAQAQAENQELKATLQQAEQAFAKLQHEIETDQAKQQATIEKAKIDNATDLQKTQIDAKLQIALKDKDNATKIRIAEINAATKGYETEAKHAAMHESQALDQDFQSTEASIERENVQHEAERTRQHEDAQAQSAVAGQIAVNAAKPQPKPSNGASA